MSLSRPHPRTTPRHRRQCTSFMECKGAGDQEQRPRPVLYVWVKPRTPLVFSSSPLCAPQESSRSYCEGGVGGRGSTPQFSLLVSGTSMMVENSAVRPTRPGPLLSGVVILMLTGCQKL